MSEETIIIDPVGMNIVNRVAAGTKLRGVFSFAGGLLVQGELLGDVQVTGGPLVLMQEGVMSGEITCDQDAYLFGKINVKENGDYSEVTATGAAFLAATLVAKANITSAKVRTYDGTDVDGRFRTLKRAQESAPSES